jgi:Family of unknown function (DUF6687)
VRYLAYSALEGVPNVIVDGSAHPDSLLTLSHWPNSETPVVLRDDLSAQIAFHYLDHPELHVPAAVVSNNHFDQDGLMSVYTLVEPEGARARRERVIDVARAGDFGTYHDPDSVRVAWTIARLEEDLPGADAYPVLLDRVPELLDHPDRFRDTWVEEDAHLRAGEAAIASGLVRIEEIDALDLAIVTVPEEWAAHPVHRFTRSGLWAAVHPSAVANATDRFRILSVQGTSYELQYRYETWVRYVSRRPPGRIDLTMLAGELTALEPGDARWVFDGVDAIAPSLHLVGAGAEAASAIPPEHFRARVVDTLAAGVSAWDPYP